MSDTADSTEGLANRPNGQPSDAAPASGRSPKPRRGRGWLWLLLLLSLAVGTTWAWYRYLRVPVIASSTSGDLVAPLLAKTSIADLTASMQGAIDGALAVAPELVSQHDALKQALAGFTALLTEAAADTTKGAWQGTLEGFLRPLAEVSGAFTQAAALLLVPVPPQG